LDFLSSLAGAAAGGNEQGWGRGGSHKNGRNKREIGAMGWGNKSSRGSKAGARAAHE